MLTVTENASAVVRDLASRAGLPGTGGLRIAESDQQTGSFELALVPEATPGDDVIAQDGATVFVAASTSPALSDLQLDADPSVTDGPGFSLVPQPLG